MAYLLKRDTANRLTQLLGRTKTSGVGGSIRPLLGGSGGGDRPAFYKSAETYDWLTRKWVYARPCDRNGHVPAAFLNTYVKVYDWQSLIYPNFY